MLFKRLREATLLNCLESHVRYNVIFEIIIIKVCMLEDSDLFVIDGACSHVISTHSAFIIYDSSSFIKTHP